MNQREIMQALLDRKTIKDIKQGNIAFLDGDGYICGNLDFPRSSVDKIFIDCTNWEIYEPPKQIKKKTMFRTVYQIGNFSEYRTSNHLSESFDQAKNLMPNTENARFVGAIEVEVCYEE